MISSHILRALDANIDRATEGLRVIEDVARFVLDDAEITAEVRDLRHRIAHGVSSIDFQLVGARRPEEDVGAAPGLPEEPRLDVAQLVRANAKRAEEALRVLEEFSRLPGLPAALSTAQFKAARFAVYEIERRLVGRLRRQDKVDRVQGLYIILDPTATHGRPELEVAAAALDGGAAVIQYRDKVREKGIQLATLLELRQLCDQHRALLIVNDDPDLAVACGADGVHVGQRDLPLAAARAVLPPDAIVGVSAALVEEAQQADAEGADYIAVGAMYPSTSKADTRPAGVATLHKVRGLTRRPLVAIGGISIENLEPVMAVGADAIAVISAVVGAQHPERAARQLVEKLRECRESAQ